MHGIFYFSFSFVPLVPCKVPVGLFSLPTSVTLNGRLSLQTLMLSPPRCSSNFIRVHFIHWLDVLNTFHDSSNPKVCHSWLSDRLSSNCCHLSWESNCPKSLFSHTLCSSHHLLFHVHYMPEDWHKGDQFRLPDPPSCLYWRSAKHLVSSSVRGSLPISTTFQKVEANNAVV